ncbi:MAG: Mrp/NBP35 family ATP-binding protein [Bacteroidales bacterium]
MYTAAQIQSALENIIHPDKKLSIVALGMVQQIESDNNGISITLFAEKSGDPFLASIKSSIVRAIKNSLGTDAVVKEIKIITKNEPEESAPDAEIILPEVKNIIAVASGKGGVGKSTIALNLAIALSLKGYETGLLDADIFGPSVPIMMNARDYRPEVRKIKGRDTIIPMIKYGIRVLSIGFFVDQDDAVVWRGPMASNFLKQMLSMAMWGTLDFLIVDLPPGTSDIHLTLVQEVAVTGAIVVSTPQEVALADAVKGIAMFRNEKINVPVLGIVENMSWFTPAELPSHKYYIFGKEGCKTLSEKLNVPLLGQIPLVQSIREGCDTGHPVVIDNDNPASEAFLSLAGEVIEKVKERNKYIKPTEKVKIN